MTRYRISVRQLGVATVQVVLFDAADDRAASIRHGENWNAGTIGHSFVTTGDRYRSHLYRVGQRRALESIN